MNGKWELNHSDEQNKLHVYWKNYSGSTDSFFYNSITFTGVGPCMHVI